MAKSYLESLLSEHEKIARIARQHWFILASSIFLEIVVILIIFAATVTIAVAFPQFIAIALVIGFVLLALPITTMTRDILVWSHHQFIVTNRRVMQISGVFNKNIIDSSLDKVNDVKMSQSAFGRMFNYGDIEILTASELGVNLFRRIEDPVSFKTAMLNAKAQLEHGPEIINPPVDIPGLISQLAQLRAQGILSEEEFQQKKADLLTKM
jgi:uncharacterized membrane protein YdbT with pleckstrin-like domain